MTTYPNWFACYADEFFARHLTHLAGQPGLRFLQIGAFTGDASVWLAENILTADDCLLVDVDTFKGSNEPEHEPFNWTDVQRTYSLRVAALGNPPLTVNATSQEFFRDYAPRAAYLPRAYDFIYVDGDHTAPGVLSDAVSAFEVLKPGGLLAFDDYQWKPYPDAPAHLAPGMAIDCFTACYQDRLEILEAGLQVWVRKTA